MMTHDSLMELTKNLPMKQINVNGAPYLRRYFVGEDERGQCWLHHFMAADSERHLHSHPWSGTSMILCGRYAEQLRPAGAPNSGEQDRTRYLSAGDINQIWPQTVHRIVSVEPNTWTLLHIKTGRQPTWAFIDDTGSEVVMRASEETWHRAYGKRAA